MGVVTRAAALGALLVGAPALGLACSSRYGEEVVEPPVSELSPAHDGGAEPSDADVARDTDPADVDGSDASYREAGIPCVTACDCDGDGYLRLSCATPVAIDAGLVDCDDGDKRRHPGQGFLDEEAPADGGDWNCDGIVEKQFKTNIDCFELDCVGREGFHQNPGCGVETEYHVCRRLDFKCGVGQREYRKQACR